jgi:hypothetical protein
MYPSRESRIPPVISLLTVIQAHAGDRDPVVPVNLAPMASVVNSGN